ncbi:MAG: response regulator [Pyrinomonadaceae bacterium]
MDRENSHSFIKSAERDLASVRSSLLIAAQSPNAPELSTPRRTLARLMGEASVNGQQQLADLSGDAIAALQPGPDAAENASVEIYAALDIVARIEALVWKIPIESGEFLDDVAGFVDASFDELIPRVDQPANDEWESEEFEVDDETLEIFRSEADELLANIGRNLETLSQTPDDQSALWEIRRNAHTFKGASGIVGLTDASKIAHRMEDLLDRLVELHIDPSTRVIEFLTKSSSHLKSIVESKVRDESDLGPEYAAAMESLTVVSQPEASTNTQPAAVIEAPQRIANLRPAATPIVRVSLDRLDEILTVSRSLMANRLELAERFTKLNIDGLVHDDTLSMVESIFEVQQGLTDALHEKLLRIRMVRFGTLETRLSRAVHVTCLDENKKATVSLENPDVEVDTQIIDALIEPLLHLLKNAVVHGIEPPDTRRLIGKPEMGAIRIGIEADDEALILSVSDDGSGISIPRLKDKAVSAGLIDGAAAASLTDREALKLIFDRGLTTAHKIDLNAGRGVGMSIVKESVENRGGSVLVESEPQRGTTFTILMPLTVTKARSETELASAPFISQTTLAPLVLIVDDSASVRRQVVKIVEGAGLRSITANNGADALELLLSGEFEPDMILSDVEMPQIDGWELLEYVKTDDNFGHIPVVMATSLDSDEDRQRATELGASDYIVKPFTEDDLKNILEAHQIVLAP